MTIPEKMHPASRLLDHGEPQKFDNGLTDDQANEIYDIQIDISRLVERVQALGRHRSYSVAITELENARLWLGDRFHKPA